MQQQISMPNNLLGGVSEARVFIGDIETRALIDTGSMVSTVSSDFYHRQLSNLPLEPLTNLVNVGGGGGKSLPYSGYVKLNSENSIQNSFPLLVVPNTQFNKEVPLLIGTNILSRFKIDCQEKGCYCK